MYLYVAIARVHGCPLGSEALDPLELEWQVILSHSMWGQGI